MISFIYFDLGGVVVKDFSSSNKWDLLRRDLGIQDEYIDSFNNVWKVHEKEICTTQKVESVIPFLEKECHASIPKDHPLLDNFVKYFERNDSIWEALRFAREHARIGLLTSMYVGMLDAIKTKGILPNIQWDTVIDSSIVGYAKPDKHIYQIAEEKSGFGKNEILFIDNSATNVQAAKDFGWQTYFYESADYNKSSTNLLNFLEEKL